MGKFYTKKGRRVKPQLSQKIKEYLAYLPQIAQLEDSIKAQSYYVQVYGTLSWCYLFTQEFQKSEETVRKAIAHDPAQMQVKKLLAHALLFQGKFEEAKAIYLSLKDQSYTNQKTFRETFLADLRELEEYGVMNKDVDKIRKLLEE